MKIWQINSWLDWTVMSESDKTFSFMDVAIFDITSVTVAVVTGKEYGLDYHCMFIQTEAYSKHNCKRLCDCERDILRLTPVKKMRLSIPKTDSVNIALFIYSFSHFCTSR